MAGRIRAEGTVENLRSRRDAVSFDLRLSAAGLRRGVPVELVGRRARSRAVPVAEGDVVRVTGTWDRRSMRVWLVESIGTGAAVPVRRSA